MTQGQYVAAAYGVVLVVVVAYVAIIGAKLTRIQSQTTELLELARRRSPHRSTEAAPAASGVGTTGRNQVSDSGVPRPGPQL
jgi:type II secretory pathway component PulM